MNADSPAAPEAAPAALSPVIRSVTVKARPEAAFRRFTAEMSAWWPLATHSVGQARAERVEMESRVGGHIIEHIAGGEQAIWGTLTAWEPPRRVAFTWHPGDDPERAQDIEVLFRPVGDGTVMTLIHSGFERLGPKARMARRGYPMGWSYVLGLYAQRRGPRMALLTLATKALMKVASRMNR